jgi:hypothetical protein
MNKYILISGGDLADEQNIVEGYFETVEEAKAYAKAYEIDKYHIFELADDCADLAL